MPDFECQRNFHVQETIKSMQPQEIKLGPLSASYRETNGVYKAMGWPIREHFSVSEAISDKVGSTTSQGGYRTWLTMLNTYRDQANNVIMWGRPSVSNAGHGKANDDQKAHVWSKGDSHQGAPNK